MSIQIFNGNLGVNFAPTRAFLLASEKITVDFLVTVTVGPAVIEWYLEYGSMNPNDPAAEWLREVAEEDVGNGVVYMPKVVRRLTDNDNALHQLAQGTHYLSAQMMRAHQLCRLQVRMAAAPVATAAMRVTIPIGYAANGT